MALQVVPLKNHLTTVSEPYYVHAQHSDTVDYDALVDIMAAGRTTLTKPDIAGCLELFKEEVERLVADGKYVKTKLGAFYLCAGGKLSSLDQTYSPKEVNGEQSLRLRFRPDHGLEVELLAMVKIERGKSFDLHAPMIASASSVRTGVEMTASAGDFLRVSGERLKFDKADETAGLFFVNGETTRAVQYASISPALVIAEVPKSLGAGSYTLVLRSTQGGKELHEGRAATPFIIQ